MTTIRDVEDFLALKRIAMVGVSREPKDFSRNLFREMCLRGYDMVPVNRVATEIEGRESFQCLQAVRPAVGGALVMTPAFETIRVVRECVETGIDRVWIYRAGGAGALSAEAIALCREKEIRVVEGHCPFMFFQGTGFPHRVHGFFLKLSRRYPAAA
jgi:uncharacterized protein